MRARSLSLAMVAAFCLCLGVAHLQAQDLPPEVKKIKDGIYVEYSKEGNSNVGIILTQEGVILIDSGSAPVDTVIVLNTVKKLTPLPIRFLINSETHQDHATANFLFSPPAILIGHEGATEGIKKNNDATRNKGFMDYSPGMRQAFRVVTPQIEYREKMTLNLGERTLEIMHLKNVHSEADTIVWLPKERVLFAASAAIPDSYNNLRPFITIPDILAGIKKMRALNPEVVIAGHGAPGTTKIFDDSERYYGLLVERVGKMVREGKSLEQIKQELRMPEYDGWINPERLSSNIDAAYRVVKGN